MGLSYAVRFTGYLDEGLKYKVLDMCDVLVLPSLMEGCPAVILEAMRASKPVVATAVGGVTELVEDGITGILVPPRNAARMAEAIIQVLCDKGAAGRFGEEGNKRFKEKFTMKNMIAAHSGLYDRLMAE